MRRTNKARLVDVVLTLSVSLVDKAEKIIFKITHAVRLS